jgi:thioredoxin 1
METYIQPAEPHGLRRGDQNLTRQMAVIEECNRLEREPRETPVQEGTGILPQPEGQPELETTSSLESPRFPKRKQHFSRCKISIQTRCKILARPNFAPATKRLGKVLKRWFAIFCNTKSALARRLIYQRENDENMNTKQAQEINELAFETEVLRCAQPVLVGFLADWSKPSCLVKPVLDEVADVCNGIAKVFKLNVDDTPDLGTAYSIQSVPTLIFFVNGTVRAKIIGMTSAKAIIAKLNSLTPGKTPTNEPGGLR